MRVNLVISKKEMEMFVKKTIDISTKQGIFAGLKVVEIDYDEGSGSVIIHIRFVTDNDNNVKTGIASLVENLMSIIKKEDPSIFNNIKIVPKYNVFQNNIVLSLHGSFFYIVEKN